jgi:molybdate transport system ATP-binding protein
MTINFLTCKAVKMLHTSNGNQPLDVSFELQQGRLLTIYGPSGAGKTTLLRILAGLTDLDSGHIEINGESWRDTRQKINIPVRKRSVGMVFQDFALFPNLTVKENLEFALQKGEDKRLVAELIELMELSSLQDIRPARLSGGQQQRVALGRAIARRPGLLLLDEPLSALDDDMRYKMQDHILQAHRQYQLTTILVSHSLPEIFRLSDEVLCLEEGRITKKGAPADIFLLGNTGEKFSLPGEIINIVPSAKAADSHAATAQASSDSPVAPKPFIVSVLCLHIIVPVLATAEEITTLRRGQKVMITSGSFQPRILPLE